LGSVVRPSRLHGTRHCAGRLARWLHRAGRFESGVRTRIDVRIAAAAALSANPAAQSNHCRCYPCSDGHTRRRDDAPQRAAPAASFVRPRAGGLRGDQADVPEAETRLRSQCEALDRCRGGITARCPWLRGDQVHQDRRHTAGENAEGASEIAEGRNSEERDFHWRLLRKRPLRAGEGFARSLGPHTAAPLARSVRLRRLSSRSSTLSPRAIGPYV
jgi:hypothetical protein